MTEKLPDWSQAVKIELIKRGKSVTDLSKDLGLSRSYVSQVINAKIYAPKIAGLIAKELGVTKTYIQIL